MASLRSRLERRNSDRNPLRNRSLGPQVGRPLSTSVQDEPLLLEREILGDHRADATGATQLGGHDGQVQQREPDIHRGCGSVEQTLGGMQRCPA